jgi:hypothetical protein
MFMRTVRPIAAAIHICMTGIYVPHDGNDWTDVYLPNCLSLSGRDKVTTTRFPSLNWLGVTDDSVVVSGGKFKRIVESI